MHSLNLPAIRPPRPTLSKGRTVGQKRPMLPKHVWAIRVRLEQPSASAMRRTKAAQMYKKTGNLRAVQPLLDHTKMNSTVRYLGIELEDALDISEHIEI